MREPWVDDLARQLAGTRNRRGAIQVILGLLVGGVAADRGSVSGAAFQLECDSSWETYCTEYSGAEQCIDFSSDSQHCGFCGNDCPDGTQCAAGSCTGSADGQPLAGLVSASAQCVEGPRPSNGDELLDVVITNNSDHPVTVVHVGSLLGPAQPSFSSFVVEAGADWNGLVPRFVPDGIALHGAVITTDAGALALPCGYTDIPFSTRPVDPGDIEETAAIMARTLSILEMFSTPEFDALFTLLHPDVRELVSYTQLACWYREYVRTNGPAAEAVVTSIQIAPWTWGGNGVRYESAAEVAYRQLSFTDEGGGESPRGTEEREATIHLVQADGIWRWFFGTDPAWLAQLPETC